MPEFGSNRLNIKHFHVEIHRQSLDFIGNLFFDFANYLILHGSKVGFQ